MRHETRLELVEGKKGTLSLHGRGLSLEEFDGLTECAFALEENVLIELFDPALGVVLKNLLLRNDVIKKAFQIEENLL